ncbi:MAG: replication factor C large subunit [Methanobacteriota archaeon]|nr:MAG: replication factor C large subunit [Euryarchaeota archaeon]
MGEKAALLYGPPGTGKTAAAHALANEYGLPILEINTSDQRTQKMLKNVEQTAATSQTLIGGASKRLILLDEADSIHGTADYGGKRALTELVRKTMQPIIITANDPYQITPALKKYCRTINFRKLRAQTILALLKHISEKEDLKLGLDVLEAIAKNADGDMRAAINDLQMFGSGLLPTEQQPRDKERNIFESLRLIFNSQTCAEAKKATQGLDMSPEDLILWLDENVPHLIVDPKSLAEAYHYLSHADIHLRRAKKTQDYSLWAYAHDLIVAGIAVTARNMKWAKFQPPSLLAKMARTKTLRETGNSLLQKIGERTHTSKRRVQTDILPYIRIVVSNAPEHVLSEITKYYGLEEAETNLLVGKPA